MGEVVSRAWFSAPSSLPRSFKGLVECSTKRMLAVIMVPPLKNINIASSDLFSIWNITIKSSLMWDLKDNCFFFLHSEKPTKISQLIFLFTSFSFWFIFLVRIFLMIINEAPTFLSLELGSFRSPYFFLSPLRLHISYWKNVSMFPGARSLSRICIWCFKKTPNVDGSENFARG